jgi:hypothetical protein
MQAQILVIIHKEEESYWLNHGSHPQDIKIMLSQLKQPSTRLKKSFRPNKSNLPQNASVNEGPIMTAIDTTE